MRWRWLLPAVAGIVVLPALAGAASSRHRVEPVPALTAGGWQTEINTSPPETAPFNDIKAALGPDDPAAALEAMQRALDGVGDGQAYIWHRDVGPLWGVVHPLTSFRSSSGQPCRRLSLVLSVEEFSRSIELAACRNNAGRWEITG
jgi:hypothetical protein